MTDIYTCDVHSENSSSLSDNDSLGLIGYILLHRAAKSLYSILLEDDPDMTWPSFCQATCDFPDFPDELCMVVSQGIQQFVMSNDFNFQAPPAVLAEPNDPGRMPNGKVASVASRVPQEAAAALASSLLIYAQSSHYEQRCQLIQCYTMDDYVYELTDDAISRALMCGYRDAVSRLDFKDAWLNSGNALKSIKASRESIGLR